MKGSQTPVAALCHHAGTAASQGPTTFGSLHASSPLLPPELPPTPPCPAVAEPPPPVLVVEVATPPAPVALALVVRAPVTVTPVDPPLPVLAPPVWLASGSLDPPSTKVEPPQWTSAATVKVPS